MSRFKVFRYKVSRFKIFRFKVYKIKVSIVVSFLILALNDIGMCMETNSFL